MNPIRNEILGPLRKEPSSECAFTRNRLLVSIVISALVVSGLFFALAPRSRKNSDGSRVSIINPVKEVERVTLELDRLFPEADPNIRRVIDELTRSLRMKDYEGAIAGIQLLHASGAMTFPQSQFVNGLLIGVQKEIVEKLSHGNANAARAAEALKRPH